MLIFFSIFILIGKFINVCYPLFFKFTKSKTNPKYKHFINNKPVKSVLLVLLQI